AERVLRNELARTRPEYGFLGEEFGETKGDGRNRWIVDPLDGTNNFVHGVPHFNISIGLERDGEIIAGVVYQPISDELFWAEKGVGAFIDTPYARSRRLRVSGRKDPARALVGTGIAHLGKGDHATYLPKLGAVMPIFHNPGGWGGAISGKNRPKILMPSASEASHRGGKLWEVSPAYAIHTRANTHKLDLILVVRIPAIRSRRVHARDRAG